MKLFIYNAVVKSRVVLLLALVFSLQAESNKTPVPMAAGTALMVLALSMGVALRAGAWWTKRVDA